MRPISADLATVQQVRSPRARVTITVQARGQTPDAPPVEWIELVSNASQNIATLRPAGSVGLADGSILKFVADGSLLRQYRITAPKTAAGWTGITPTTVHSGFVYSIAPVRIPGTSTIRLFYLNGNDNNVYYRQSTNNGTTWSNPVQIYSGADARGDLVAAYIANGVVQNGPWFFGFTTSVLATGVQTPRFGYHTGSAWVTHPYDANWRAAGIHAGSPATAHHTVLVTRQEDHGPSRIRALNKIGSAYNTPLDIDQTQAGLAGVHLANARYFQLPEANNATLGLVAERAYGGDTALGISSFFVHPPAGNARLADEPIALPNIKAIADSPHASICSVVDGENVDLYIVGDTVVYRGAAQPATTQTLEPIRYKYQEGLFDIDFPAEIDRLHVGQILVIQRELSWGALSGNEVISAYIIRVEQRTDGVNVLAADPLAYLGIARCRRPVVLSTGNVSAALLIIRLAARVGLPVNVDDNSLSTAPALPFTLQPNESLKGAVYRASSQTECYLVPANDGTFGLTIINPPTSDSGHYNDTAHVYGAGSTQQPIARAAILSDYRRLAFSYILGSYSTDPEDGAYLKMAAGPVVPNTRPISYSLTNMRYNTAARVAQATQAEAARQKRLTVDGFIEAQANLALELYDKVEITEPLLGWSAKEFRVRALTEQYDRGRLTQRIELGEEP